MKIGSLSTGGRSSLQISINTIYPVENDRYTKSTSLLRSWNIKLTISVVLKDSRTVISKRACLRAVGMTMVDLYAFIGSQVLISVPASLFVNVRHFRRDIDGYGVSSKKKYKQMIANYGSVQLETNMH